MTPKIDPDFSALKAAAKALKRSASRRMLIASLDFLNDYFHWHPSKELPKHLKP